MICDLFYTKEKLAMKAVVLEQFSSQKTANPRAASAWRARSARAARRRARAASDSDLTELFNVFVKQNMNHFQISLSLCVYIYLVAPPPGTYLFQFYTLFTVFKASPVKGFEGTGIPYSL